MLSERCNIITGLNYYKFNIYIHKITGQTCIYWGEREGTVNLRPFKVVKSVYLFKTSPINWGGEYNLILELVLAVKKIT